MAIEAVGTGITEDDLLRLGAQDKWIEVVNGEIVEMNPVGIQHVVIADNVSEILRKPVKEKNLGYVFSDSLIYVLERSPNGRIKRSRIPDVSFVRRSNFPKKYDVKRPFPGAPDLAVEVVSPDESAETVLDKVRDYLKYGSEQVWVLYPDQHELHQYVQGEDAVRTYRAADTLEAPTLFPGLKILVGDLFILPDFEQSNDEGE
jgi:Uma2 family endonuclease